MKMEWKVSVFPEKNGNREKPMFRFVGSRHRAKPTFKSRMSCSCLTLLHGSTPHGRSACHSPQTEYTITFPPACRWIAPWSTSGRTASCSTDSQELFTCMLWPAVATFERGAVMWARKRCGRCSLGRRAASMPAPVRGRVCSGRA